MWRRAALAGLAVWQRGQRCQGFVCNATSVPEIARMGIHPGQQPLSHLPTPSIHADIRPLLSPPGRLFTPLFFLYVFFSV